MRAEPALIVAPRLLTSRDQVKELLEFVPDEHEVVVDCRHLRSSGPSAVDELVRGLLLDRRAPRLVLVQAPERTIELARRFAMQYGVADRLSAQAKSMDSKVL